MSAPGRKESCSLLSARIVHVLAASGRGRHHSALATLNACGNHQFNIHVAACALSCFNQGIRKCFRRSVGALSGCAPGPLLARCLDALQKNWERLILPSDRPPASGTHEGGRTHV
jgi:hypothetical protein